MRRTRATLFPFNIVADYNILMMPVNAKPDLFELNGTF